MSARPAETRGALDALAALRLQYAHSLPRRIQDLARAVRAWRRAPDDAIALERARTLAHRLRGTVGSYGFLEIGVIFGEVEDAIRQASRAPAEARLRSCAATGDAIDAALRDARARSVRTISELSSEMQGQPSGEVLGETEDT